MKKKVFFAHDGTSWKAEIGGAFSRVLDKTVSRGKLAHVSQKDSLGQLY
jgi:hypothetical protein